MTAISNLESPVRSAIECPACGLEVQSECLPTVTGLNDYLTHESFDIVRCSACNLQVTQPLPFGDDIGRHYPPRYRGNRHAFTGSFRCHLRRRAVEACFKPGFRGRILDVGCGDGSFALHMLEHGWDVCATEIDAETVDRLCRAGIDAKLSAAAEREGFDAPFDAVTCWHVLEHVENPRQVADWVRDRLSPAGVFQATVPNVDCLQARIFGRHWVHLDVPRHRQHFTANTLEALLKSAGFNPQRRSNFALEYDWFGVIQSALNAVCTGQNVLFEMLTRRVPDPAKSTRLADEFLSVLLAGPIAFLSLPAILIAAMCGDGATLTLSCR